MEVIEMVRKIKRLSRAPKGFVKTVGATTAPRGFELFDNRQSRFSGRREIVLVKKRKR